MARRSKVDALPAALKAQLERLLADRSHGGYEALAEWLRAQGYEIGKSSLHRYDARVQRTMAAIRASTEAARQIVAAHPDDADEHSAAVIRMVQSRLFEALVGMHEAEADPADQIKLLAGAARAIADASRASIGQKKWADEVREKLSAIERDAAKAGRTLDAATLEAVKRGLYGG